MKKGSGRNRIFTTTGGERFPIPVTSLFALFPSQPPADLAGLPLFCLLGELPLYPFCPFCEYL